MSPAGLGMEEAFSPGELGALNPTDLAAASVVASALLNYDETITKR